MQNDGGHSPGKAPWLASEGLPSSPATRNVPWRTPEVTHRLCKAFHCFDDANLRPQWAWLAWTGPVRYSRPPGMYGAGLASVPDALAQNELHQQYLASDTAWLSSYFASAAWLVFSMQTGFFDWQQQSVFHSDLHPSAIPSASATCPRLQLAAL